MSRSIRAPRGPHLTCRNWQIEAAYRMLQNNLDPEVAFDPDHLIVYGGRGRAARNWESFDAILAALEKLQEDETLLVQSGKPVGVLRTHTDAPRVLLANSNIVPAWATQENFDRWEAAGLIMYGQMTAGSWIYIGTQGILQGTYETLGSLAHQAGWQSLRGKLVVTAGLGEMGGAAAAGHHHERRRGPDRRGGPLARRPPPAVGADRRIERGHGGGNDMGERSTGRRHTTLDRADRQCRGCPAGVGRPRRPA